MSDLATLLADGPVVIDGGLSTQLERLGHRLTDSLWTARTLLDDPAAVAAAHRAFAQAGARIVISASYQVSRAGFAAAGLPPDRADEALGASVVVAREAVRDLGTLVAASVGPYGAISHDGAEYRGRYGRSHAELIEFHAERMPALVAAEPDLLAVETIPDVDELAAVVEALPLDLPAWVSVTAGADGRLRAGQPIEEVVSAIGGHPAVVAVGVNCTDAAHVPLLLRRLRAVTTLPLVAYPNAIGKHVALAQHAMTWVDTGATIIGGCCGTDADDIAALTRRLPPSDRCDRDGGRG